MATIIVPTNKLTIPLDGYATSFFGGTGSAISASNGGVAVMYAPYETFTATNILFQYAVTTAPSPATFDVGIQGFNATTGQPNGTFVTSGVWTCPASGSGFANVSITPFSVTKGNDYYLVIRNATAGYTGNVSINVAISNNIYHKIQGSTSRSSGVWSAATTRPGGAIWLYSGSKYYGNGLYTVSASETARSSPNEIGTTFQLPANHPTLTLTAMAFYTVTVNTATVFECRVRNSAGTLLATSVVDGDFCTNNNLPYFEFNNTVDFVAGQKYYIMLSGTTGTPPLLRTCVNHSGALMTDIRNGIVANVVEYDGTTFTESVLKTCQGFLTFNSIKYDQTAGTTNYIIPAGFNQLG